MPSAHQPENLGRDPGSCQQAQGQLQATIQGTGDRDLAPGRAGGGWDDREGQKANPLALETTGCWDGGELVLKGEPQFLAVKLGCRGLGAQSPRGGELSCLAPALGAHRQLRLCACCACFHVWLCVVGSVCAWFPTQPSPQETGAVTLLPRTPPVQSPHVPQTPGLGWLWSLPAAPSRGPVPP